MKISPLYGVCLGHFLSFALAKRKTVENVKMLISSFRYRLLPPLFFPKAYINALIQK